MCGGSPPKKVSERPRTENELAYRLKQAEKEFRTDFVASRYISLKDSQRPVFNCGNSNFDTPSLMKFSIPSPGASVMKMSAPGPRRPCGSPMSAPRALVERFDIEPYSDFSAK